MQNNQPSIASQVRKTYRLPLDPTLFLSLVAALRAKATAEDDKETLSRLDTYKVDNLGRAPMRDGFLTGTGTPIPNGRMTITRNALQNVPRACRGAVRLPGRAILSVDYVAAHLVILAVLSGDPQLQADALGGLDPYTELASALGESGLPRDAIKIAVQATLNGQGPAAAAKAGNAGVRAAMERRWPVAFQWMESIKTQVVEGKYTFTTPAGRKVDLSNLRGASGPTRDSRYRIIGNYLQAVEADAMAEVLSVMETGVLPEGFGPLPDGLDLLLPVYDEAVWLADAANQEEQIAWAVALMQYGLWVALGNYSGAITEWSRTTSVRFGSFWGSDDRTNAREPLTPASPQGSAPAPQPGGSSPVVSLQAEREAREGRSSRVARPALRLDESGRVMRTSGNLRSIVRTWGGLPWFWYNEFSDRIFIEDAERGLARPLEENDKTDLRCAIADAFGTEWAKLDVMDEVMLTAQQARRTHPVREYLDGLVWDGVPRIDTWLQVYLRAEGPSRELMSAYSSKYLVSMVARVFSPGCKVDTMLIVKGRQGAGKSSAFRALVGADWHRDSDIDFNSKDGPQVLRGAWGVEIGELASMRKAEADSVKKFLSTAVDSYRPSYGRVVVDVPRQAVFYGTTNQPTFLSDTTGSRRFWVVESDDPDVAGIQRDRDQLWAEAVVRYRAVRDQPYAWWLAPDEDEERDIVASEYQMTDVMAERIIEVAGYFTDRFTCYDIINRLAEPAIRQDKSGAIRVSQVLRQRGYVARKQRLNGVVGLYWTPLTEAE